MYNTPYKPGKKSAPPLFLEDENVFQKSARVVLEYYPELNYA
jgi:hypothetical protein